MLYGWTGAAVRPNVDAASGRTTEGLIDCCCDCVCHLPGDAELPVEMPPARPGRLVKSPRSRVQGSDRDNRRRSSDRAPCDSGGDGRPRLWRPSATGRRHGCWLVRRHSCPGPSCRLLDSHTKRRRARTSSVSRAGLLCRRPSGTVASVLVSFGRVRGRLPPSRTPVSSQARTAMLPRVHPRDPLETCWRQPLTSSRLVSSAPPEQAERGRRPQRSRGLRCALAYFQHRSFPA